MTKLRRATENEIEAHNQFFSIINRDQKVLEEAHKLKEISGSQKKKILAGIHNTKVEYIKAHGLVNRFGALYTTDPEAVNSDGENIRIINDVDTSQVFKGEIV